MAKAIAETERRREKQLAREIKRKRTVSTVSTAP